MVLSLYYIVDGSGNYYRVNSADQLVAVESKVYAGVFSFAEANRKIGGGKKAHFYSVIPVEDGAAEGVGEQPEEFAAEKNPEAEREYNYDIKSTDWEDYLNYFCYLASTAKDYQEELKQALSDVDMQICDILHYIELYDLDEKESIRMVELLKECREQRRDVKDEMIRVECFQKSIGTSGNVAKVKDNLVPMKKLDTRMYHPRKLPTLFKTDMDETVRQNKLERAMKETTCLDDVARNTDDSKIATENSAEPWYEEQFEMEGEAMEYRKQETVLDGQHYDWIAFAKQQEEFYANAEQYIINLQLRQEELEEELEQVLEEVENANYNVTQGYNVYKRLKELRTEKKNIQKELEALYILTYGVDCAQVADNMAACVKELKELYGDSASEKTVCEEMTYEMPKEDLQRGMLAG